MTEIERLLREELEKEKAYSKNLEEVFLSKLQQAHEEYLRALESALSKLDAEERAGEKNDNRIFKQLSVLERRLNDLSNRQKEHNGSIATILEKLSKLSNLLSAN